MIRFLKKILGGSFFAPSPSETGERDRARYAQERAVAKGNDPDKRLHLARSTKTHKEILYYLAKHDPDPMVRRAVAENTFTPVQVSLILARDQDMDVRYALAARLVVLLPHLSRDRQTQLYSFAVQALGTLALDETLRVRLALASALKDCADAPSAVVGQLARDAERVVSEPILRFCTALADEDLLDILKAHPASWVVQAVAARAQVSASVSQAVVATKDELGGVALLENDGAALTPDCLSEIIEASRLYPKWQKTLAGHKSLSSEMARELARFIEPSLHEFLLKRTDFSPDVCADIVEIVTRRVSFSASGGGENARDRARQAIKEGRLTENLLQDALSMRDYDFIAEGLALLARTDRLTIDKLIEMKAPKPLVSVCWLAGLSMRFALSLQRDVAHVERNEILYARGGTDYPLSVEEMKWQLDFHSIY